MALTIQYQNMNDQSKHLKKLILTHFIVEKGVKRSRAFLFKNSDELGLLSNNRFNLLSETDEEEGTDNDLSEASNKTQAIRNNQ